MPLADWFPERCWRWTEPAVSSSLTRARRIVAEFRVAQEHAREEDRRLEATRSLPAKTLDGVLVTLMANAEFPEEATAAAFYGAQGIGLFRSEYLLGRTRQWPTEDEQVDVYRRLLDQFRPFPVTVRTWDVGVEEVGDGEDAPGPNPALGQRALRLARKEPGAFQDSIAGLAARGDPRPHPDHVPVHVGTSRCSDSPWIWSRRPGPSCAAMALDFCADVPIGLTIEVPSAAATIDLLQPEIEFLSVGTNDLIQYLLAVDRRDPRVAGLYQPLHPAVLRTIRHIVEAAAQACSPGLAVRGDGVPALAGPGVTRSWVYVSCP